MLKVLQTLKHLKKPLKHLKYLNHFDSFNELQKSGQLRVGDPEITIKIVGGFWIKNLVKNKIAYFRASVLYQKGYLFRLRTSWLSMWEVKNITALSYIVQQKKRLKTVWLSAVLPILILPYSVYEIFKNTCSLFQLRTQNAKKGKWYFSVSLR